MAAERKTPPPSLIEQQHETDHRARASRQAARRGRANRTIAPAGSCDDATQQDLLKRTIAAAITATDMPVLMSARRADATGGSGVVVVRIAHYPTTQTITGMTRRDRPF